MKCFWRNPYILCQQIPRLLLLNWLQVVMFDRLIVIAMIVMSTEVSLKVVGFDSNSLKLWVEIEQEIINVKC